MVGLQRIGKAVVRRCRAAFMGFFKNLFNDYAVLSYSQYGEDMVLRAIFARYPHSYKGFYVDVGAHHPKRFSNTYYFYERGWRGICIDPRPSLSKLFARDRKYDICLELGVAENEGTLTYYMFKEPALNTFSELRMKNSDHQVIQKKIVMTMPLRKILAQYMPVGCTIDILSIDAEGFDLQVIRSNDFQEFRPRIPLCHRKVGQV